MKRSLLLCVVLSAFASGSALAQADLAKAQEAFNAAGLLVPASVEPSRLEAVAAAPGEPRAAGAACDDFRIGARPPLAARAAPRAQRAC